MRQIETFSDDRLNHFCAYCGGIPDTRDHSPSKIFLTMPFPTNLPVVPACFNCNNGFSLDEEYLGCLLECTLHGTANPDVFTRQNIANILNKKPNLKARMERAKRNINGKTYFEIEVDRVKNVITKLAQGHCRFESSESQTEAPELVWFKSLNKLTEPEAEDFFILPEQEKLPEVGCRMFMEVVVNFRGTPCSRWVIVQPDNYQYSVSYRSNQCSVKIIIWGYLACKVVWS